ncbi:uncharacterized protein LY89DRAFT_778946 [Mollisia scopiformis]|uniref:ribonuclease T1 n=1 Tax=Mollisia scopiformis TaxID=149040 RepID=A0A194XMU3_MOLSC|nr:uncharacterized protein LY89DRAFT_778946 [Mollisia scopiformis]KUJ21409.1 hypothetical protein LY89DRAFT_778946 [Mollisia scopiformis]
MQFLSFLAILAATSSCVSSAAIDNTVGLSMRDELDDIINLPTKSVRCGGSLARAEIHTTADIKKAATNTLNHLDANTVVGDQNYPKRYGYRDPAVTLSSQCSATDTLYEFPITRGTWNGVPGDTTDIPDRIIIKRTSKKGIYCGLITHTGAPASPITNNPFQSCTG